MIKVTVLAVDRDRIVKTGEEFLDVTVQFHTEEGEVLDTRKYGYPLDTPEADIKEDLAKAAATFEQERLQAEAQKEADAVDEQAKETKENLEGLTL